MGMIYCGQNYIFSKNLQGDVVGIYNENRQLVAKYSYNAFGAITSATDLNGSGIATINPFRYRGYYYDTETGFYYLQSRYYDPVVGRFLNADAFVSTGQGIIGNNMFAYCGNNPIRRIDIYGTWFLEDAWNWTNKNIVQPVVEFVDDEIVEPVTDVANNVIEDFNNYDSDNQSESVVIESHYFSNYKGTFVIKTPFDAPFSFGFIGLSSSQQNANTLNHEYGHTIQMDNLGVWDYTFDVAIPSMTINILQRFNKLDYDYYGAPWEAEADRFGGVHRTHDNTPWPQDVYSSYFDLIKMFWQ